MFQNLFNLAQVAQPAATPATPATPATAPAAAPIAKATELLHETGTFSQACLDWITAHTPQIISFVISLVVLKLLLGLVDTLSRKYRDRVQQKDKHLDFLIIDLIGAVVKCIFWGVGILFIAQNSFGLNVTTMIAGAGVTSLAVAFAAQNTVANIFGAVSLILDKPFTVGERIKAKGHDGIIEGVNIRSTRLRTLDGDLVVIPNKELSECPIENLTAKPNFKTVFNIGLTYSTTPQQMQQAMTILQGIFATSKLIDAQRQPTKIFFTELKDWSLNIQVISWLQTQDFFAMSEEKSRLNLEILKQFNDAGLDFAFPSQSLYLAGDTKHPVEVAR